MQKEGTSNQKDMAETKNTDRNDECLERAHRLRMVEQRITELEAMSTEAFKPETPGHKAAFWKQRHGEHTLWKGSLGYTVRLWLWGKIKQKYGERKEWKIDKTIQDLQDNYKVVKYK